MARRSGPVDVQVVRPPLWRRLVLPVLLLAALAAAIWYFITTAGRPPQPDIAEEATDVRSEVTRQGDSLEVAVDWQLSVGSAQSVPESVRVEVGLSDAEEAVVSTQSAERRRDTLLIPAPGPGQTASGYSCVSPVHRGRLLRESCTPWQFVVPSAEQMPEAATDTAARRRRPGRDTVAAAAQRVLRIVVQPSGLQVDPDEDGRCAAWQRRNPTRSVWVEVNRKAVADCTGPNGKPTVAQFCAFAVLLDGSRVKTQNSGDNPYCERLFQEWSAERVS